MLGSDLSRRRSAGSEQCRSEWRTSFCVPMSAKSLEKLVCASSCSVRSARAIMLVAELWIGTALLKEDRHHLKGILCQGLSVRKGRGGRSRTSKHDVRISGTGG